MEGLTLKQGAASLIFLSQMKNVLGIKVSNSATTIIDYMHDIVQQLSNTLWQPFVLALVVFIFITGTRLLNKRIPGAFIALVICTFLAWSARFDAHKISL